MKLKKIISNIYIRGTLLVMVGLLLGWIIFHHSNKEKPIQTPKMTENKKTIWTCAMHPQIRMDHPGKCPICGMDLIPLDQIISQENPAAIEMTEEAIRLADVQTSLVSFNTPVKEVRLYGKVQADERLIQTQPAHVPGRIEKLMLNFTGEEVRKGQTIAQIYSPELITAQKELLEALKMKELQPQIFEAAKEKLRQWKLNDKQIAEIGNSGIVKMDFDVHANVSGIVITRNVNVGDYVSQGTPLFEIADLSHVWIMFDAYESDLPWIRKGNRISFTVQSQPGKEFSGIVSFIDPVINSQTRVARVRVEIANYDENLKPEMFVTGILNSHLPGNKNYLIIPQSAVLWTGTRSIVYVKDTTTNPSFLMREVTLGPALGTRYVILAGLQAGEEIVTNGTFAVDASAELAGKPSMMNPEGADISASMPGMDMGGVNDKKTTPKNESDKTHPAGQSLNMDMQVDIKFKDQLTRVYKKYLELKDALFASDLDKAKSSSSSMHAQLTSVDMTLLKGDSHNKWMELVGRMNNSLDEIDKENTLEMVRKSFAGLSSELADAVKMFGLNNQVAYYQYCPMANNNAGAYWLSQFKEIKNPYLGSKMPACGDTKEVIK